MIRPDAVSRGTAADRTLADVVALALLAILVCSACWFMRLDNNVSWQLWVARQMRAGAVLYRDIVEPDPPLWFWEAMPVTWLAERIGLAASHIAVAWMSLQMFTAAILFSTIRSGQDKRVTELLTICFLAVTSVLAMRYFSEREHVLVIAALPWIALCARRREGDGGVSRRIAIAVGLFSAHGFAMKPHFAIVPLALEAWLVLSPGRGWRPVRPETVTLGSVAVVYVAAIVMFAPSYLSISVRLTLDAYGAFTPSPSALVSSEI